MEVEIFDDLELYQRGFLIQKIGNEGVRRALEENRQKGVPSVYVINGIKVYELPNGTITTKKPKEFYKSK